MTSLVDAAVAGLGQRQLGLVTLDQCRGLGLTDRMRRQRLLDGRFMSAGSRVLRFAAAPVTWKQQLLAATLETGEGAVVSHMAAAAWWAFPGVERGAVEVSLPRGRRLPRAIVGMAHRPMVLSSADVQRDERFLLTTPARTLIDLASRLSLRQMEAALDELSRQGRLSATQVATRLAALGDQGRHGSLRLRHLLASEPAARSSRRSNWLERRALSAITSAGLLPPEPQARIDLDGKRYYADLLFVTARLVVELDGHGSHATRRERQHDAERAAALTSAGFRVVVFTYEDIVERPGYVVATLRQLLAVAA